MNWFGIFIYLFIFHKNLFYRINTRDNHNKRINRGLVKDIRIDLKKKKKSRS